VNVKMFSQLSICGKLMAVRLMPAPHILDRVQHFCILEKTFSIDFIFWEFILSPAIGVLSRQPSQLPFSKLRMIVL